MRITLDESEMEGSRRKHALGTTEQFESIDEVVTYLEARLRELGKAFTVKRYEGSPMQGLVTEIDVHDPPIESLYTITDADAYLEKFGYEAEEAAKFLIRNGPFIEALISGDERVAAYYIENQSMTGNPGRASVVVRMGRYRGVDSRRARDAGRRTGWGHSETDSDVERSRGGSGRCEAVDGN